MIGKLEYLISGGDERLLLDNNQLNSNFVNPIESIFSINRGSCTCSGITKEGEKRFSEAIAKMKNENFDLIWEDLRKSLKNMISTTSDFEIFIAPSGTDLCYYPILLEHLKDPLANITSIVTCYDELGSGSIKAYSGEYYFKLNQFGRILPSEVKSFNKKVNAVFLPSRDEKGEIINHNEEIKKLIAAKKKEDRFIVQLVVGSKSGIIDDLSIIDELAHANVTFVIDACQYRISNKLIEQLLNKNCMVAITGSKFFQAPPFCGAFLVPKTKTDELLKTNQINTPDFFKNIFSYYDFPEVLGDFRKQFLKIPNKGVYFRWVLALEEMQQFFALNGKQVDSSIKNWRKTVLQEMNKYPCFELMPVNKNNVESIISFKLKVEGNYADYETLKVIRKILAMDLNKNEIDSESILLGQPVEYPGGAFLRMAIGSMEIRNYINGEKSFADDINAINIISQIIPSNA